MNQEMNAGTRPEGAHTYRELCVTFFEIKMGVAAYTHKPFTQTLIDHLPPMVRLANEQKIKELGFNPNITDRLRSIAENNKSFEKIIPADAYQRAIKGSSSRREVLQPSRRRQKDK